MTCHLFGAKTLPMLAYCRLDSCNKFQWNLNQNSIISIKENAFEIVICQNGGHFVQGEMSVGVIIFKACQSLGQCLTKALLI